jgi:predicted Zn-dependent peptidase
MRTPTQTRLRNGTRTILLPHEDASTVTLLVMFAVGSRYESPRINGAAHFIEHLLFKGTAKRPTTMDISRELDAVGADYNAFTSKDYTGYYIRLAADKLPMAADMLHDMLYGSLFRAKDVDAERKVINEEIRMYEDNPSSATEERMEEDLFRTSSLGWRIAGSVKSLAGITRKELIAFHGAYYAPDRTVIAVAGKFAEADALRILETTFGARKGKAKGRAALPFSMAKERYAAPRITVVTREIEQASLAIGFPAYGYTDPRLPALKLLATILGGTMSSRLFLSVREKHGLCYSISASVSPFHETGYFTVQSGLAKDRIHKALDLIVRELRRIRDGKVTAEELKRAQENLKGRLLLSMENSNAMADWYARQLLLTDRTESPEQRIRNLMAVTREDVQRVAKDVLRKQRLTMTVLGAYTEKDRAAFARHIAKL